MTDRNAPSDDALAFHREHPAIDLHADTLMWSRWLGYDVLARHEAPLPRAALGGHLDVPRMRDGGMAAQFFGLVSLPIHRGVRGVGRAIHEQIDALDEALARQPSALRRVHSAADIEALGDGEPGRPKTMGALLGIEGAHALEGDLGALEGFARRGVRYLGLLHFSANEAGFPAYGRGRKDAEGLTDWGRDLVRACEAGDVLVDLAHINKRGFMDVCAMAQRPPIVSHTGVLGAFEHWRNVDDEQLRAVAERGGCVGVIFCPRFLGGDGLGPVIRHLRHILDVVGEDVPALGSDWDGFIVPTGPLKDPRGLPLLTTAMLEAGFPPRTIAKILRGNVLRVLSERR